MNFVLFYAFVILFSYSLCLSLGSFVSRKLRQKFINPIRNPEKETTAPLCYAATESRFKALNGRFVDQGYRMARYWNLTCPLEISKQSCSHQGNNLTHAEYAANLQFTPDNCKLLQRHQLLPYFALDVKWRMLFVGNSLLRQVMVGMICDMHGMGLIHSMNIKWHNCESDSRYPCHGTLHCIECGEHSGTEKFTILLRGGGSMQFVDGYEFESTRAVVLAGEIGADAYDLIVVQQWHMEEAGMLKYLSARNSINGSLPRSVWMASYSAHFPDGGSLFYEKGGGRYNATYLEELSRQHQPINCLESVANAHGDLDSLGIHKIQAAWSPDGYIWLPDINNQGQAKVGNMVGKYGDCQHYCEPGPADEVARAMLQLILALHRP